MAKGTDPTVKFKADITEFKKAMQEASRAVRLATSEFNDASAGVDKWAEKSTTLSAKLKSLNDVLKAQKKQLDALEKEYDSVSKEQGENSRGAEELKIQINNQKAAIKKTEAQIESYSSELKKADKYGDQFEDTLKDMDRAAESVSDGFTVVKGVLADLVADGIRLAIDGFKDLAKATYNAGANFESSMSRVEAIAQATPEDMERITEKAKEMGATTKFTATEAGDAMFYMAQAGWEVDEIIGGLEGVMHLAAASGEDLAQVSDIVTDALTAMGYSAKDATHFADVLAQTAANSNTNVALMGTTFQYAAPIIGTMGYSMEDAAVAMGLMANAGIKGQKAGTALRSVLTNLSAPTEAQAGLLDELGISLRDSGGEMKSLHELMNDLRKAFQGLSEDEKTAAAKTIAGKYAMSGFLAVVNSSDEDFNDLSDAINNCTDASQTMADTMLDNVDGQVTILKSKVEGIMIKIFENASDSIREGIDVISESLDKIDWDAVGEAVGRFAKKALEFFVWIIDNRSLIFETLKSIAKVLTTIFVVKKLSAYSAALTGVITKFTALRASGLGVVASLKKVTSAGGLFANLVSPGGAIVLGITAVIAVTARLIQYNKKHQESVKVLTEEQEASIKKAHEMYEAYQETDTQRRESTKSVEAEYNHLMDLKEEYNSLIDTNGEVKKGYEDRAEFIKTTLAEALGMEYEDIQALIDQNGKLADSIDDVIKKKQAEATLSANDEAYKEAIKNIDDVHSEYLSLSKDLAEAQEDYQAKQEAYMEVMNKYNELYKADPISAMHFLELPDVKGTIQDFESTRDAVAKLKDAYTDAENTYVGYQTTIQNYEGLSSAIISGDAKKINQAIEDMKYNFQTAETSTKESLARQTAAFKQMVDDAEWNLRHGMGNVTQEQVDQLNEMYRRSQIELEKSEGLWKDYGDSTPKSYADEMKARAGYVEEAGEEVSNAGTKGLMSNEEKAKKAADNKMHKYISTVQTYGKSSFDAGEGVAQKAVSGLGAVSPVKTADRFGQGYVGAIGTYGNAAFDAGKILGDKAKEGTDSADSNTSGRNFTGGFVQGIESPDLLNGVWGAGARLARTALNALKKEQEEGSPSKLTRQSGKYFGEGYALGIESMTKVASDSAKVIALDAYNSLRKSQKEGSPSKLTYESGVNFTKGYINGIASQAKNLKKAVKDITSSAFKQALNLKDYNFSELSTDVIDYFSDAMSDKISYMIDKITYQNEAKLEDFENTISKLEDKLDNEKDEKLKKQYQEQIDEQKKIQKAYQSASSKMLSEFESAMSEYQSKATDLITATLTGISDAYEKRYDELVGKQDSLIEKLKSTGDLFEISGAGVMTVNDITEQTKQIKDYTAKLQKIKSKVSSDLFDQITSYDMKEGSAFIDRLLALSDKELKAYSDAYDEKLSLSESLSKKIYKNEFTQLSKDYKDTINRAFDNLPKQLEKIGNESLKGFVDGFTKNTDYLDKSIKTFVKGMVDQFKKELKIKSPSRVMMQLGEYSGEGFGNGLKDMIGYVKKTATEMAQSVTTPLDDITASIENVKWAANGEKFAPPQNVVTNNNYNLVQNNTSPRSLSALETYQARRQQIAMVKAMT